MPNPAYAVYVGSDPADTDGPRTLKTAYTVDTTGKISIDLTADAGAGNLRFVQSVYFDLADLATNVIVTLIHRATGFRIRVKGGTQGFFPIAATDALQFDVVATNVAAGVAIPLWFGNHQAPNFQWASV